MPTVGIIYGGLRMYAVLVVAYHGDINTEDDMTIPHIPQTIINQFGAGRTAAMIGGTYLYGDDYVIVKFKVKANGGRKAPNCFKITYNYGLDLYDIEFIRNPSMTALINGAEPEVIESLGEVYAEDLRRIFEDRTGLYLSL